jgi:HlyD family secretion protein
MGDMKKEFFVKKKKTIIVGAVVLAGVLGIGFMKMQGNAANTAGPMVNTYALEKKNIERTLSLKAPLEGTESAEIVSNLHYEVVNLFVKEGDRVKKGQILAQLDSESLLKDIQKMEQDLELLMIQDKESSRNENQSAEQARLDLEEKLKDRQVAYEKDLETLNSAKRKYESNKELVKIGAVSEEDFKNSKSEFEEAQRVVNSYTVKDGKVVATQAELKSIENAKNTASASRSKSIAIAKMELERKKQDLADCQIKSPIDGTITRVNIKLGRFANETDDDKPMFVVENIDKLQMKVLVSEYDIDKVKVGQKATVSADILAGKTVEGVVVRISPTGEEKASGSGERVIPAVVEIQGEKQGLIAGINAKAKIMIAQSKNTFVVPIDCLLQEGEDSVKVLRVNDQNKVESVPVTTGVENDLEVEIFNDTLKAGDRIILSPTADLVEGSEVTEMGQSME